MNYMNYTYETLAPRRKAKVLICLKCGEEKQICQCTDIVKLLQSQLEVINND